MVWASISFVRVYNCASVAGLTSSSSCARSAVALGQSRGFHRRVTGPCVCIHRMARSINQSATPKPPSKQNPTTPLDQLTSQSKCAHRAVRLPGQKHRGGLPVLRDPLSREPERQGALGGERGCWGCGSWMDGIEVSLVWWKGRVCLCRTYLWAPPATRSPPPACPSLSPAAATARGLINTYVRRNSSQETSIQ